MKKIIYVSVVVFFVFGLISFSWVEMCGGHMAEAEAAQESTSNQKVVNVGNKICPVTGDKINETTKATYEYEGKIYNFCCPMCIEQFKKDPDKYIKKIEQEKQAQSQQIESEEEAQVDTSSQQSSQDLQY